MTKNDIVFQFADQFVCGFKIFGINRPKNFFIQRNVIPADEQVIQYLVIGCRIDDVYQAAFGSLKRCRKNTLRQNNSDEKKLF